MHIQKIKYNSELIKNKLRLQKELVMLINETCIQQEQCNHIRVCLGWDGPYQYRNTSIHSCLFCQEYDPDTEYKTVDASEYKKIKYSHGENEIHRINRLLDLQDLVLTMITESPLITEDELIEKLENIIEKDEKETKKLEKNLGHKIR